MYLYWLIRVVSPLLKLVLDSKNLNYFFLFLGILTFWFPVFLIANAYTMIFPSALVLGAVFNLIILHRDEKFTNEFIYSVQNNHIVKIITMFYFLTLSFSIYSFYISGYHRSVYVHLGTYMLFLFPIALIILHRGTYLPLILTILTAIFHRATIYLSSKFAYGVDPQSFYRFATSIASNGSIVETALAQSRYYYSPSLPIGGAITNIVTALPIRDGAMFIIIPLPFVIISGLLIFKMISFVWSGKVGIFSVVLYLASDHALGGILTIGPTQYGLLMFILIFYLYIRYCIKTETRVALLSIVLFISLIMSHQLSTFIVFFSVLSFSLTYEIYNRFATDIIPSTKYSVLILSFLIIMFLDWLVTQFNGPSGSEEIVFDRFIAYIIRILTLSGTGIEGRPEIVLPADVTPTGLFASATPIHVIGTGILFGLAILGSLYWIDQTEGSPAAGLGFGIGGTVFMIFIFIVGGQLLGLSTLRPTRWFVFFYFLLAILAAPGLAVLWTYLRKAISGSSVVAISVILLLALTGPYIVLMGGNVEGSIDGPLFDQSPGAERLSINYIETQKIEFTITFADEDSHLIADRRVASVFNRFYDKRYVSEVTVSYGTEELLLNDDERESLILYRSYQRTNSAQYTVQYEDYAVRVHGAIPIEKQLDEYNKIYEVGDELRSGVYHNS